MDAPSSSSFDATTTAVAATKAAVLMTVVLNHEYRDGVKVLWGNEISLHHCCRVIIGVIIVIINQPFMTINDDAVEM